MDTAWSIAQLERLHVKKYGLTNNVSKIIQIRNKIKICWQWKEMKNHSLPATRNYRMQITLFTHCAL
jgi:hypothetical protein